MGIFIYLCVGLLVGAIFPQIQKTKQPGSSGLMSPTFFGAIGAGIVGGAWDILLEQDSTRLVTGSSLVAAATGACTTFGLLRIIRRA